MAKTRADHRQSPGRTAATWPSSSSRAATRSTGSFGRLRGSIVCARCSAACASGAATCSSRPASSAPSARRGRTRSTTSRPARSFQRRGRRRRSPPRSPGSGPSACCAPVQRHAPDARFFLASSSELFGRARRSPQNERTPFRPRSPYGRAKLWAHQRTVDARERHGLFACCGILYNHESPRRRPEFVTRKITSAVARIAAGQQSTLELGSLGARRDWGDARDVVRAMWAMLQQPEPRDLVIADRPDALGARAVRDRVRRGRPPLARARPDRSDARARARVDAARRRRALRSARARLAADHDVRRARPLDGPRRPRARRLGRGAQRRPL